MPTVLTRVPAGEVPPLAPAMAPVVVVADVFMLLLLSRPATGSLRRTWVTPATLGLAAAAALAGVVLAVWLALGTTGALRLVALPVLLGAAGAGSVALVGTVQRRSRPAG